MNKPLTAEALSRKFAELVFAELADSEREAILAHPKDDECCITHDFMDPNQLILDAYEELTGEEADVGDDDTLHLFNTAWTLARDNDWWQK